MLYNIRLSFLLLLIMYIFFGLAFPIGKIGLQYSSPIFFTGFRLLLAGLILLLYQFIFDRKSIKITKDLLLPLVIVSICTVFLTNVLEYWGLQYLLAAKTYFIYNFSPLISAFISYLVFKERMTIKKWIGLAIGFFGFLPILIHESPAEELSGELFIFSGAELAVLCAAVTTVLGWVYMRKLTKDLNYSPVSANAISMIFGGLLCFPTSLIFETWDPVPVTSFWPFIQYVILLMIVANLIGYSIYAHIIRVFTVTFITFVGFLGPIFTAIFGWIMLSEVPSWEFFASTVLVFIGLFLFYQEELSQGYVRLSN